MDKVGLFCASSNNLDVVYYENAARLGKWLAENGKSLVYGGSNCGIMEAVAKAVNEYNGKVIGVIPQILFDRNRVSNYIHVTIPCSDLNDRKQMLIDNSDVLVVMPGGIGTLDEVFTVMAANTIGIHSKKVIFWNLNGFWNELFNLFDALKSKNVLNKPMNELCSVAESFDDLIAMLQA